MEQLLSTFVLFRGCLKEREDRFRIRYSSDIRTFLYVAD